jgi:hypothetical protein
VARTIERPEKGHGLRVVKQKPAGIIQRAACHPRSFRFAGGKLCARNAIAAEAE